MSDSNFKITYISAMRFEDNKVMRGGLLVCDTNTMPLEFRCTDPIKPSELQRILYGRILGEHLLIELIGVPLIGASNVIPDLVFVPNLKLLGLRKHVNFPVLYIGPESSHMKEPENSISVNLFSSSANKSVATFLAAFPRFEEDLVPAKKLLDTFGRNYDFVEPFSRITQALEQVHKLNVGGSK